jgi:hypothetical protein
MPKKEKRENGVPRYLLVQGTRVLLGDNTWTLVLFFFFERAQILRVCGSEEEARRKGDEFQQELAQRDPGRTESHQIGVITPDAKIITRWDLDFKRRDLTYTIANIIVNFF